jgi:hypothetical protein
VDKTWRLEMKALSTMAAVIRWYEAYFWIAAQYRQIKIRRGEITRHQRVCALANYGEIMAFLKGSSDKRARDFLPPPGFWPDEDDPAWSSCIAELPESFNKWKASPVVYKMPERLLTPMGRPVYLSSKMPAVAVMELPQPINAGGSKYDVIIAHSVVPEGQQLRRLRIHLFNADIRAYEGVDQKTCEMVQGFITESKLYLAQGWLDRLADLLPDKLELDAMALSEPGAPIAYPVTGDPSWSVHSVQGVTLPQRHALMQAVRAYLRLSVILAGRSAPMRLQTEHPRTAESQSPALKWLHSIAYFDDLGVA